MNSESLSAGQRKILDSDRETRAMLRRLRAVSITELNGLLAELSEDKRQRVLDAMTQRFYEATSECSECLGKTYRGVANCGRCQGTGRESKDFMITRLMSKYEYLKTEVLRCADGLDGSAQGRLTELANKLRTGEE